METSVFAEENEKQGSGTHRLFESIKKRNGQTVPFNAHKIQQALAKAGEATGEFSPETAKQLTFKALCLAQNILNKPIPHVEEIQDLVEEVLLSSSYKKTAKSYILYRDQHSRMREISDKSDISRINSYVDNLDWQVNENSNMAFSLQGLNNYISGEVTKTYWLNKIYPEEIRQAHKSGDFHIHDLGLLSVYCVGWDLKDLLASGFRGVYGKSESLPARHFRSALGQIVNFFYTLQGEAAGAQAFSNFDTYLAPFIRYDNLSYEQVKQSLQEFIFNLNVPTRVGFQTPFTNVTLDLQPPDHLKNEAVVIGGEVMPQNYSEFQHEMNLFNRAFLEVLTEGDARGRVFSFPIPTYNITKDFNWKDPTLLPLWEVTAKYGIPYFANFVNSDMKPEDTRSMCCRLRLDLRKLDKKGGGLFGSNPLTGSIGVVTINMPRIAHLSENEEEFLIRLESLMGKAKTSLEIKRKMLEKFTDKNLYPYTRFYLRQIKMRDNQYWKNHFSTIGLIGMNEACLNLLGKDIGTEEGMAFSCRVLDFMRDKLKEFQNETGNNYNLEATPAEGTSYRLAKLDKEKYTEISLPGETSSSEEKKESFPFYTNSTQLPVDYTDDIFMVLEKQDPLQKRYTGGTVLHTYLGEAASDPYAVREFIKKVCTLYALPYFTLTPSFSICPEHGYLKGEIARCPECGEKTEIYSRVVGYIRPLEQWNRGKLSEFRLRKKYSLFS